MNKIKKFYKNNRVYCILMGISIFCIALICVLGVGYFINQTKNSVYGNRLNGIDSVIISDEHKNEVIDAIKENGNVSKAVINVKGKIIYINVYLEDGKIDDAQSLAIKSLNCFTDDEKEFYDINFSFVKEGDNGFTIMGYKKSDAAIISWTKVNGE